MGKCKKQYGRGPHGRHQQDGPLCSDKKVAQIKGKGYTDNPAQGRDDLLAFTGSGTLDTGETFE